MNSLALVYSDLPDIDDAAEVNASDRACIEEVRAVLERHGKLNRFGITLLHQHFPVYADEILLETCDQESRTLTTKTVKKASVKASQIIETSWRLSDISSNLVCTKNCYKDADGRHMQTHPKT